MKRIELKNFNRYIKKGYHKCLFVNSLQGGVFGLRPMLCCVSHVRQTLGRSHLCTVTETRL